MPTTIVWGLADRIHRKPDTTSSRAWHSHAEFVEWPDVGHGPDRERPDAFASLCSARGLD